MIYVLGGGTSLNYKVVGGTTQPSNPKENWIWVNTEAEITSHVFSATEPANPAEGMVWFNVGTFSAAPINVLKKNVAMLYPTGCKQYVSGAWVNKTAKTYQNGAWVDWTLILYENGNQYTSVTGGWAVNNASGGISAIQSTAIYLATNDSSGVRDSVVYTKNPISFNKSAKTLNMNINITYNAGTYGFYIGLTQQVPSTDPTGSFAVYKQLKSGTGDNTLSVDISNVSGKYYVVLYASVAKGNVSKIWIE